MNDDLAKVLTPEQLARYQALELRRDRAVAAGVPAEKDRDAIPSLLRLAVDDRVNMDGMIDALELHVVGLEALLTEGDPS